MICPEYYRTVDMLMGISTGHPHTTLDLTEIDIVELLISLVSQTVQSVLVESCPETFFEQYRGLNISQREEEINKALAKWDERSYYTIPKIWSDVETEVNESITKILTDSWDYYTLMDCLIAWSDLAKKDSPIIQYYHKLIELRDSHTHPSFAMHDVFSTITSDITDQLSDAGYFGNSVHRVELKKIPWKYRSPF